MTNPSGTMTCVRMKKRKTEKGAVQLKRKISFFISVIFCLSCFFGCAVQTPQEYYSSSQKEQRAVGNVTLEIECKTVLDNWDMLDRAVRESGKIPQNGIILAKTQYAISDGDTVFDVLKTAVRENKIQMEYQGAEDNALGSVYIEGINYLYEFSCGDKSGWMYSVNGEFPSVGCDSYALKDGDNVQLRYTCTLGEDIGKIF